MMLYKLLIGEEAREQLRSLPKSIRRNIGQRLESLQDGLAGDVKKLTAREHKYRLRWEITGYCSSWKAPQYSYMLLSTEERPMNKNLREPNRLTVRKLQQCELQHLRRRVEDLEDLRDLNAAIERNAGKPGVPWEEVKRELEPW
jgi:hypothetical protein